MSGSTAIIGGLSTNGIAPSGAAYLFSPASTFKINGKQAADAELSDSRLPTLAFGETLSGFGSRLIAFTGAAGSAILVDEGDMALGDPTSFAGFSTEERSTPRRTP